MRLDVYPRKMVVRSPVSGSLQARCQVLALTPSVDGRLSGGRVWLNQAKRFAFRGQWLGAAHGRQPSRRRSQGQVQSPHLMLALALAHACGRSGQKQASKQPTHHVIDNPHSRSHRGCLEAHGGIAAHELVDGDGARRMLVEVDALHLLHTLRHRLGWLQHGICGAGGCGRGACHGRVRVTMGSVAADEDEDEDEMEEGGSGYLGVGD